MCHLYDIDEDNTPIKHTQFKHSSVQGAMATAQAESDFTIKWLSHYGIVTGFIDSELVYQIEE